MAFVARRGLTDMGMPWPSSLPAPLIEGYNVSVGDEVARTDMESGAARVRRRSVAAPDKLELSWIFSATQMAIFRAYWDAESAGGASWCDMVVDVGDGLQTKTLRFVGQYKSARISGQNWRVSCAAEAKKQQMGLFDYLNLMGLPSLDLDFAGTQSLDPVIVSGS